MSGSLGEDAAFLLAFCVAAEVVRELLFKAAARRAAGRRIPYPFALARQVLLWLGIAAWAVEMIGWVLVLERLPLGIAFPIMTITYAAVPLAGMLVLGERLTRSQVAGAVLVAVGVVCVGAAGT